MWKIWKTEKVGKLWKCQTGEKYRHVINRSGSDHQILPKHIPPTEGDKQAKIRPPLHRSAQN